MDPSPIAQRAGPPPHLILMMVVMMMTMMMMDGDDDHLLDNTQQIQVLTGREFCDANIATEIANNMQNKKQRTPNVEVIYFFLPMITTFIFYNGNTRTLSDKNV